MLHYNHLLVYGANFIPGGEYEDLTPSVYTPEEAINLAKAMGGVTFAAHPNDNYFWDRFRMPWQDYNLNFDGLQIWNYGSTNNINDLVSGIEEWKNLLKSGRHVYIEGGTDAHGDFNTLAGRVKTYVYIPGYGQSNLPAQSDIIEALRNGHSIMTDGPIVVFDISNETSEKAIIGDKINGSQFSLNIEWKSTPEFGNVNHIFVYRGIVGEDETELSALSFTPNDLEGTTTLSIQDYLPSNKDSYIRINATTDKGYRVYTNPIWINKSSVGRSGAPDSFGYTFKDSNTIGGPTYEWIEISGTGAEVLPDSDDDVEDNINIGFFFNYYGTDYSQLAIANNGLLFSSGTTGEYVNEPITNSPSVHGFIAPFWDDLITYDDEGAGTIYYKTLGTSPNRMFVVEWYDNKHYGSSDSGVTFEAILYEGSNNIKFQYKDVDFGNVYDAVGEDNPPYNNGGSATVGIEAPSGDVGLQYSFNEPVINPGMAILFKFPQYAGTNLYLSKQAPASKDHGSTMTYTLYYHNFGDTSATNVMLEDTLSPEVEFVSASDGGSYDSSTRKVTWNIGSVAPGGHGYAIVTVRIQQSAAIGTVIQNNARISTSNLEVRYDDNEAQAQTGVTGSSLPPDVSVEPNNGGATPSVVWHAPITFTYYSSCATGVGINIHLNDGGSDITDAMAETSPDTWTYTTSFNRTGEAAVTYIISGCATPSVSFNIYIDPAGYIYDTTTGARIAGASVWLQRPDGSGGWENVPTGQTPAIAQPDSNPLITGADGQYQWDVLEGSYRVHVEAQGYYPADSIVVSIPPPVTDLHVGLTSLADATPPTTTAVLSGSTGNNGWYTSEVHATLTATDNPGGSGVNETEYSLDGTTWITYTVPFNISSEGTTIVYYRSTDNAGNVESTNTRTIKVDTIPPSIGINGVSDGSYYNSDVTPVITITDANLDAQSITLNGAPYTSGATVSAEGSYTLVASGTDKAGNSDSKTLNFVIDRTSPEAAIRFDTISKDIEVYNNETGGKADYTVLPSKNENLDKGWELRQYTLKDPARNSLVLILNHKKEGKEARVKIISMQYKGGAVIAAAKSNVQAQYSEEKNGALRELEQKIGVDKLFDAQTKYSAKKDETEINVKVEGQMVQKETRAGIGILELLTDKGGLWFRYY